jgi:hypothetical protein
MSEIITSIDKSTIKDIETALMEVMPSAMEEVGLNVEYTRGRYSNSSVEMTFTVSVPGLREEEENKRGKRVDAMFGVGFEFTLNGEDFVVTGFNLRRPKYPVSVTRVKDGQRRKFTVDYINREFNRRNGGN